MEKDPTNNRKKRFRELWTNSRNHNAYYFTDFMTASDAAEVYEVADEKDVTVFGGMEDNERVMIRFGNPDAFGYTEDFPITILQIAPLSTKFAEELTHRDYLGTLMGLGIERDVIGDIRIKGTMAYLFAASRMADYIIEHLTTVKHTTVTITVLETVPADAAPQFSEEELIVASLRLDGILAKIYHLSREKTKALFAKDLIFINGRTVRNPSLTPKESDVISVRGYGKFIFDGQLRETKKGNTVVSIRKYI